MQGLKADRLALEVRSYEKTFGDRLIEMPDITDKAAHAQASDALRRARYERDRDEVLLGRAIGADAGNQANARRSTGPRTTQGKGIVRLNALRHGLLARDVVLPGEDADAFEDLWNQVRANFSPVGPIEEFLADRVANAMWRLQRLPATRGAWNGRSFGPSTSSASYKTDAGIVPRPPFRMPLRWPAAGDTE